MRAGSSVAFASRASSTISSEASGPSSISKSSRSRRAPRSRLTSAGLSASSPRRAPSTTTKGFCESARSTWWRSAVEASSSHCASSNTSSGAPERSFVTARKSRSRSDGAAPPSGLAGKSGDSCSRRHRVEPNRVDPAQKLHPGQERQAAIGLERARWQHDRAVTPETSQSLGEEP